MAHQCELTIALPAYREAESLRNLLPRIKACAERLTRSYEILIVDAQTSVDDTERVCAEHGVRHVFRTGSNSFGDAIRTAIRESFGRFVVNIDADGSHDPDNIARLWEHRNNYDVVIGSRYIAGGHTEVHACLTLMSQTVNVAHRVMLGLHVRDMSNNFRLYHGDQVRALSLVSTNFEILQEILVRLVWGPAKAKILEVPIFFEKRKAGESKRRHFEFILSYMQSLMRLRRFRAAALEQRGS